MNLRLAGIAMLLCLAIAPARPCAAQSAPARDLAGIVLDGPDDRTTLAALLPEGPAIVHLWATWCAPCRKELPELARFHAALADRGLGSRLVLVSVDTASYERVTRFLREDLDLPDLRSWQETSRRAGTAFRILGYPSTIRLDGARHIVDRHSGPLGWGDLEVQRRIISFLTGGQRGRQRLSGCDQHGNDAWRRPPPRPR